MGLASLLGNSVAPPTRGLPDSRGDSRGSQGVPVWAEQHYFPPQLGVEGIVEGIMDGIVDFDLGIDLLAAETSNFADQFLEHVGIDLEQFSTQPDPFVEPDPKKVKTEAPSHFADQFLEHVGIDLEQFSTQPDPFVEPDPENVKTEAPSHFADQFLEHVGIDLEQFSTQPDPFVETNVSLQPVLTTCEKPPSLSRFAAPISTESIEQKVKKRVPKKTQQSTKWGMSVWTEWAVNRNMHLQNMDVALEVLNEPYIVVPTDLSHVDPPEMNHWLSKFVFEIRRMDGKPYPPKTLYLIVSAILRHFREDLKRHDVNFLDKTDSRFAEFRKALDARMKELTAQGIGVTKKQADPLTTEDENCLWEKGAISTKTSQGLSYGVFFYNCKIFGLRGMDEHQRLMMDQYKFGTDNNGRYVEYTGRVSKNVQGGLQQRQVDVKTIKQHASPANPRCVVNLFEQYFRHLPEKSGRFYRRPLAKSEFPKFSIQPVGVNKLSTYMKSMCIAAGISLDGRRITNHSGKVTLATQMWEDGFDEQTIMSRTGHRSTAVRAYKRPSDSLLMDVSNKLQPPLPKPKSPIKKTTKAPASATVTTAVDATTTTSTSTAVATSPPRVKSSAGSSGLSRLSIVQPDGLKIYMDF
ncbi:hypothetical protein Bbelb_258400 [Branchiostoma belcheri]|nr:hypothetical protein Bbelb_258400 [Branchiostoma belcheri]